MAASRVAVVGGGLAGLSAAAHLKRRGHHVELFERSRLLGGRATSFQLGEHVVDNGQHVFLACCTEFVRFVNDAGMGEALYLQPRFDVVAYSRNGTRGRLRAAPLPAPLDMLASFASYAQLSMRGKIDVTRALTHLRLFPARAREDQTFAQWLKERGQGAEAVAAFWEPFLVPALNAPLDRMNAAEAAFVLSTAFFSDAGAARFGYSTVPLAAIMDRAARDLDAVHRSTAILAGEVSAERVRLQSAGAAHDFEAAVFAVSPRALAKLLPEHAALGIPPLDVYEPFAIMDVHLWYDGPPLRERFAALLGSPLQWIFQKGDGYVCCSMSAADELVTTSGPEMTQIAWNEVRAYLPELKDARLLDGAATRNPEGTYLAPPGAKRPAAHTALPNVAVAGAWTATGWPDTMESAVRSGIAAAQVLLESNLMTRETSFV